MAVQKSHKSKGKKTLKNNLFLLKKNYSKNFKKVTFKKVTFKNLLKFF
jgi:hypothetical protein